MLNMSYLITLLNDDLSLNLIITAATHVACYLLLASIKVYEDQTVKRHNSTGIELTELKQASKCSRKLHEEWSMEVDGRMVKINNFY